MFRSAAMRFMIAGTGLRLLYGSTECKTAFFLSLLLCNSIQIKLNFILLSSAALNVHRRKIQNDRAERQEGYSFSTCGAALIFSLVKLLLRFIFSRRRRRLVAKGSPS